ncbi:hypothetical protein [Mycolicibacterium madagascariense]|nr:hypothetical protein [Mycolicibacterium madagascariense]MCV7014702.1 hypothetical protein [Mycolicibacterium madagascariense]
MAGDDDSGTGEPAWHERTSTVVGASAGALAVIALLWFAISYVTSGSDAPPPPTPQYSVQSSDSGTTTTTTATSTETITSTSPPMTSDINPGDTSATTTSGTSPSTDTTTSFNPSNLPHTKSPTTYDDGRTRPRYNETRTLYPHP